MKNLLILILLIASLKSYSQETTSPVVVLPTEKTKVEIDYEKFTDQRDTGKILEFIGATAIATASYFQIKYSNDNADNAGKSGYKRKEVSPYIPLGGLGVMAIGFAIDIGASKHLRKR